MPFYHQVFFCKRLLYHISDGKHLWRMQRKRAMKKQVWDNLLRGGEKIPVSKKCPANWWTSTPYMEKVMLGIFPCHMPILFSSPEYFIYGIWKQLIILLKYAACFFHCLIFQKLPYLVVSNSGTQIKNHYILCFLIYARAISMTRFTI